MTGPVVVGVDGSPAGMTAAWWAASEALDRHLPVLLIHSWTTQPLNVPIAQEARSKQQHGREVLQRAEAELVHRYDGLAVTTQLVQAPAAQALLDHSERAALLVLGSRGHGSAASFLLGSISLHVLGLTQCPAVTVRADDPAVEAGWGHPAAAGRNEVVVGVQEPAAAADPLLEFAFTTAELHGTRVHAVRALPLFRPQAVPVDHDSGRHEVEARAQLTARLAPWREVPRRPRRRAGHHRPRRAGGAVRRHARSAHGRGTSAAPVPPHLETRARRARGAAPRAGPRRSGSARLRVGRTALPTGSVGGADAILYGRSGPHRPGGGSQS